MKREMIPSGPDLISWVPYKNSQAAEKLSYWPWRSKLSVVIHQQENEFCLQGCELGRRPWASHETTAPGSTLVTAMSDPELCSDSWPYMWGNACMLFQACGSLSHNSGKVIQYIVYHKVLNLIVVYTWQALINTPIINFSLTKQSECQKTSIYQGLFSILTLAKSSLVETF